ncbi:MAG: metal-dependent transcriptional regulator [Chloroflexi bacterium]|nr:metal-dependent transcriptional regulator [Chloroflexota bacterium]
MSRNKPKTPAISAAVQDFLGEIYLEAHETGRVSLRALADRLDVSPPAISRMAQRLVRQGFMRREGACGLLPSESRERVALQSIRKRRIFEAFLVARMGYTWDQVYPIAVQSSNHLDEELVERMFEQAGRPLNCPHGDPIPTHDGHIHHAEALRLTDLPEGRGIRIARVASHDGSLLRYLGSLNLKPGVAMQLVARAPFNGPLRLRMTSGSFHDEHVIGAELAEKIFVVDSRVDNR